MNTFILFSAAGIILLVIFGFCVGYYQSTLYIEDHKGYLIVGILCFIISLALFYFAFVEYTSILAEKSRVEDAKVSIPEASP